MLNRLLIVAIVCTAASTAAQDNRVVVDAKNVDVLTFKLHYLEAGRGAPVVLLHGLGGDGSRWKNNVESLAKDFHIFALDQIGFGQSDKPLANYHTGMLAEFLVDFLKAVNVPKASLVGNSMGASVALYTAVRFPQIVDKVVLADGGSALSADPGTRPVPPPQAAAQMTRRRQIQNSVTREETREFFRILFHHKELVTDSMVDEQLAMRLRSAFAITRMQEAGERGAVTAAEVHGVKAPTLIVWGKYDELADPARAEDLERLIPGSKKVIIDDCGHMPQIEKADEFNRLVREFLLGPRT
jgi:pimeloyl-ACP methyl ester carboxylesterase